MPDIVNGLMNVSGSTPLKMMVLSVEAYKTVFFLEWESQRVVPFKYYQQSKLVPEPA